MTTSQPPRRWLRLILSRLLLVVAGPVIVLGGLELVIRGLELAPRDEVVSPLSFQRRNKPVGADGPDGTRIYFGGRPVVTSSRPAGLRIFVYGESAAQGERYTPFAAFAGWLQRYLRAAGPEPPLEVINLGIGGIGSRQVRDMVMQTLEHEPASLLVLYTGNNEFHELRAIKAVWPEYSAQIERFRRSLSRFHLYRLLRGWLRPPNPAPTLPPGTRLPDIQTLKVSVDERDRALATLLYRQHLEQIATAAREAGVPALLTTVADNWMDTGGSEDEGLSPEARGEIDRLARAAATTDARAMAETLARHPTLSQSATAYAMVGRAMLNAGRDAQARWYLERAETLWPRPRTSNAAMRRTVLEVARQTGVASCDTAAALAALSPHGVPGDDVFRDACHPNALGHQRLGQIMARCVVEQGLLPFKGEKARHLQQLEAAIRGLPLEGTHPFRLDHWVGSMDDAAPPMAGQAEQSPSPPPALEAALAGHRAFLHQRYDEALDHYVSAMAAGGPPGPLQLSRGLVYLYLHRPEDARDALSAAVRAMPDDVDAMQFLSSLGRYSP